LLANGKGPGDRLQRVGAVELADQAEVEVGGVAVVLEVAQAKRSAALEDDLLRLIASRDGGQDVAQDVVALDGGSGDAIVVGLPDDLVAVDHCSRSSAITLGA